LPGLDRAEGIEQIHLPEIGDRRSTKKEEQ